jgi:succinylarginine dihydrolase
MSAIEVNFDGLVGPTHNPEGIFAANCSFVAVQKGVSLRGAPAGTGTHQ